VSEWEKAVPGRSRWEDAGIQLAAALARGRSGADAGTYRSRVPGGAPRWYAVVRIGLHAVGVGMSGKRACAWRRCLSDYLSSSSAPFPRAPWAASPEELALKLSVSGGGEGGEAP